tara:strand:- start:910 stop:1977 length:1068 start_codon:yes stop_codon:yes gene_type:complete
MQATLHKKSGGMHHVKKSGGMKHMKKTGGMATTKKTGGMKKIGGMNMTKKSGGKCGMPLATSGGMHPIKLSDGGIQHVKKSGGMHHKTVKGGMYHSKKHGGSRKLIGGTSDTVTIGNTIYKITVDENENGNTVTVANMGTKAANVPPPPPPLSIDAERAEDGGPLKAEDLNTNNESAQLNIDPLTLPPNEEGNVVQEGNELMNSRDSLEQYNDADDDDANKEEEGEEEGEEGEEEGEEEEEEEQGDMFKEVGDSESAAEELIKENSSVWNEEMEDMLGELNNKGDEQTDDDKAAIKLLTDTKEMNAVDGGKKKGGKTLKKGGKPVKKHGGSVKKAFNKLFKRGGNKALPKKGGKK